MRGRMGGMSGGQLVLILLIWIAMLTTSGVLLMIFNTKSRFSLRWLFVCTTFVGFVNGVNGAAVPVHSNQ
jgi:hypothetical protein